MDLGAKVIETFTHQLIKYGDATPLPKAIIIEENVKYKIKLDLSANNFQARFNHGMRPEVKLSNGATIKFHRDESSDFDNVQKGVITSLRFNEIGS